MYATNGLTDVLGISGEELKGKSFYHCIQENCLHDAVRCLENAKSNDSIAYLRFWFREPRQDNRGLEQRWQVAQNELDGIRPVPGERSMSEDNDPGGIDIGEPQRHHDPLAPNPGLERSRQSSAESQAVTSDDNVEPMDTAGENLVVPIQDPNSRGSSNMSNSYTHEAVFGEQMQQDSSASSTSNSPFHQGPHHLQNSLEVEAVVSCTSDGLVVCLRRAKDTAPVTSVQDPRQHYDNGLFAVPWATSPEFPPPPRQVRVNEDRAHLAHAAHPSYAQPWDHRPGAPPTGSDFMNTIRDIAIFAWALVGINGTLATYSKGRPRGEAAPAAGVPVWQPQLAGHSGPELGVTHAQRDIEAHHTYEQNMEAISRQPGSSWFRNLPS